MHDFLACCEEILNGLYKEFSGMIPLLIMTVRKRITNEKGQWSSIALIDGRTVITGDLFDYIVLDRYGAGDSCSAGIIGGFLGVHQDGTIKEGIPLEQRIQTGLNLGNRMSVVVQKTVNDIGPQWSSKDYFKRVGKSREISR